VRVTSGYMVQVNIVGVVSMGIRLRKRMNRHAISETISVLDTGSVEKAVVLGGHWDTVLCVLVFCVLVVCYGIDNP